MLGNKMIQDTDDNAKNRLAKNLTAINKGEDQRFQRRQIEVLTSDWLNFPSVQLGVPCVISILAKILPGPSLGVLRVSNFASPRA